MEKNNLTMGIIGAMICIILLGGLLMPAVSSALVISGDPTTYYNDSGQAYRPAKSGDVLIGTRTVADDVNVDTWTLNGEPITGFLTSGAAWTSLIFSDGMYGKIFNSTNTSMAEIYDIIGNNTTPKYVTGVTLRFTTDTIEVTAIIGGNSVSYSWAYTWAYIPCPSEDGVLIASAGPSNAYVLEDTFLVVAGFYSTGEIDRFYYSNDSPDLTIIGDGSGTIDKSYTPVEGTTDIYNLDVKITVTDGASNEEFGPFQILVPYKIDGHKDSGAAYSMIAILPIIAIVSVLIAAIYVFIGRKY